MALTDLPPALGFGYLFLAMTLIWYLLKTKRFTRTIGTVFLLLSVLFGFLIFSPMLPVQFLNLISRDTANFPGPVLLVIALLLIVILGSWFLGRIFCGYICPLGTIQEIASMVPVKKKGPSDKTARVIHTVVGTLVVLIAVLFSTSALKYLGVNAFFNIAFSSYLFWMFIATLGISIFVYRPVCRFICPYGLLLSFASKCGVFGIHRTEKCSDCGLCQRACPSRMEVGKKKMDECYLCMRCIEACHSDALEYRKK